MNKQFLPPGIPASIPPPAKTGWDHSEQVLVYYEANPEAQLTYNWGIAYYHYKPPFDGPNWTDFSHHDRTPTCWWYLPKVGTGPLPDDHAPYLEQIARLQTLIRNLLSDLPHNRDWLNPDLERQMKEAVKK